MSEENDKEIHKLNRRSFMKLAGGAVAIGSLATGGWFVTEMIVDEGVVDTWHKSVCRYCGTGCAVMLGMSKENKLVRVRGDQEGHNKGVICIKGSTLNQLMQQDDRRIKYPMIRKNGKLERATWDEAMSLITDKFKESIAQNGPDSVGFYGSGQLYIEESYTANKLFKAGIRTNNVDGNPRLCMASAAVGYTQTFGKDEPPGCYDDMDHADCFFIIGSNTYVGHPPLWERIMIRKKSNPNVKIIVVDPRYTETAERADMHLPVTPGTDMLLLNSMMYCFIEQELYDQQFIDQMVNFNDGKAPVDFEKFKQFLEDYKPEKVANELGLTPKQIRLAAYWFGSSPATMSLWTMGINQREQGVFLNNNLNSMHLVTGQINRKGATPLSLTGQCNACGGVRDTGTLSHLLPNGRFVANPAQRAEMEKLWKVPAGTISPKPGYDALAMFDAMNNEDMKACLVMCTNPAQSLPNNDHYRPGMSKAFLAVADVFESETTKLADVVLPAALYIEKTGVYGQTERRYQLIEKLKEPAWESKSDFDILVDFAERMGHGDLINSKTPEACWDEYREISTHSKYNFYGMTRDRLKVLRGLQWPCIDVESPGTARRYIKGDPFVPEGKEQYFYGKPDGKATVFLRPFKRIKEVASTTKPLYLTTGRVLSQWHTGTMTRKIPELDMESGQGRYFMHPEDANRLNLKDGDLVSVESSYGVLTGQISVSPNETPGVIFASFYDPNFMINKIVTDDRDPISKEPVYKVTAVSVSKTTSVDRKK